jgi:hypothetical protein
VPGEGELTGFFVVLAGMVALFGALIAVFKRQGWL